MLRLRKNSAVFLCLVFFCFLSSLAVADGKEGVVEQGAPGAPVKVENPDSRQANLKDQASEAGKDSGYLYDPTGKVDPFKSFIAEQEAVEEKKRSKPKTYLETLDLAQLELVAVILNKKENYAMVRDAKGLGHVIKKGTAIGINGGVVSEIKEGTVIVREKYRDFRGDIVVKEIKKELPSLERK